MNGINICHTCIWKGHAMEFRPCIDIHNGKVKQIVGGSLREQNKAECRNKAQADKIISMVQENFVSEQDAPFYAEFYKERGLQGGHIILLNPAGTKEYEDTKAQALAALEAYPGGLQVGGGINPENACEFLRAGASHVIVTSYVFRDGRIDYERLKKMRDAVGKEHLVLDMSCKKKEDTYRVVTDRWQKETKEVVDDALLDTLAEYCDEFLIHAVDVEGKAEGIEKDLVALLGKWGKKPVTYAGGVHNFQDLELLRDLGKGHIHVTIGSALDIFGGNMDFEEVVRSCR